MYDSAPICASTHSLESSKEAILQLFPHHGRGGFRTCDLSRVKPPENTND